MPKMFVHAPESVFDADARKRVAAALTDLGLACERLPDTPEVRNSVWVFFADHAPDAIFTGGRMASSPVVSLTIYTLDGGLDGPAKRKLIAGATSILGEHGALPNDPVPAYVVVREVSEADWGMFGSTVSLAALRAGG